MAKLDRKLLKQWGSSGVTLQFEQFGSFAANAIVKTKDILQIQGLSAWLQGWFGAVNGSLYPTIQDMNSLFYVIIYQLCYILERGLPEWDATTNYFIGSMVSDGNGVTYKSLTDNNLNNPLTDSTKWATQNGRIASAQYIIGSTTEKNAGYADYDTIAAALTDHPNNASFLITKNYSGAEALNLNATNLQFEGQGNMSVIGAVTFSSTYCSISKLRVSGAIDFTNTSQFNNASVNVWLTGVPTDEGTDNKIDAIQG